MAGVTAKGGSATLSISGNEGKVRFNLGLKAYLPVTVFCLMIFLIYDRFSHGVRSPYMTYLFMWPLVLGLIPSLLMQVCARMRRQKRISANLYHPGVAAVTVSSLLRGIFEIAGTSSDYQVLLMIAGGILLLGGFLAYLVGK